MKKVLIYTTPTCIYCQMTKAFFKENNIEYTEKDVALNDKAREEMIEKTGQIGVPVVDIDGKIVIGFDKGKLSELLEINS